MARTGGSVGGPERGRVAHDSRAVWPAARPHFGLAGWVFTSDPGRGLAVARSVRTGTFGIDGHAPDPLAPFGGAEGSGTGREWGPYGLDEYVEATVVNGLPS